MRRRSDELGQDDPRRRRRGVDAVSPPPRRCVS
ncbi:hypothetical protein HNQ78_000504 [Phycisphaera mikurensis]|nr:hypothetical protein [Phycisphaera mikurensis]